MVLSLSLSLSLCILYIYITHHYAVFGMFDMYARFNSHFNLVIVILLLDDECLAKVLMHEDVGNMVLLALREHELISRCSAQKKTNDYVSRVASPNRQGI